MKVNILNILIFEKNMKINKMPISISCPSVGGRKSNLVLNLIEMKWKLHALTPIETCG